VLDELEEEEEEKVELVGEERQGKSGRDGKVSSANMKSSAAAAVASPFGRISPAGAFPRPPASFSCECGGDEPAEASMQRKARRGEGERDGCVCGQSVCRSVCRCGGGCSYSEER
jgi:hypothetical protein